MGITPIIKEDERERGRGSEEGLQSTSTAHRKASFVSLVEHGAHGIPPPTNKVSMSVPDKISSIQPLASVVIQLEWLAELASSLAWKGVNPTRHRDAHNPLKD